MPTNKNEFHSFPVKEKAQERLRQFMNISVVVPVFNSEASLQALVDRLLPVLQATAVEFELILVNDGSRDGSWAILETLEAQFDWIRTYDLMRNYGQHNALLCGILGARHEIIVTLDDDLQHPPEEIPKLLSELDKGADVVYGYPERPQHGFLRNVATRITKLSLAAAMGVEAATHVSAFRAFRRSVRRGFEHYRSPIVSIDVLLTWGSDRFSAIPVRHDERAAGPSNYTVGMLILHAINMLTGFSTMPLRLASLLGLCSSGLGLGLLLFVTGRYFFQGVAVPGFAFTASSIVLFAGLQLFALGILGEYLARVHLRTMDKPPYLIRGESATDPGNEP